jgi:intracellular sulfur oxidation DsrE/DsrF family protein
MPTTDLKLLAFRHDTIRLLKNLFLSILLFTLFTTFAPAADRPEPEQRLKIVFEIHSGTDFAFEGFLAKMEGHQKTFAHLADIAVVATADGVGLLREGNLSLNARLAALADRGIDFIACSQALEELKMDSADLVRFARTVRSGPRELEKLKEQGWAHVADGENYVSNL